MDQQVALHTSGQPPILMLALARHDGPYASTAWSLARAFAKEGPVLYIDNPFTVSDFFKAEKQPQIRKRYTPWLRRRMELFRPDEHRPNLWVVVPPLMLPVNWLPAGFLYGLGMSFNRWLLKGRVDRCLRKAGMQEFIFMNSFNPFYGATPPSSCRPLLNIYQTVDAIGESNYIGKHGPRLEKKAMQQADFCVATSMALTKKASKWNQRAFYIPNAADTQLFAQALEKEFPKPAELRGEQRPVICYTGHIDHRLDYELLNFVARRHRDKLFLMVGPVSGKEWKNSGFSGLENVLFTGKKPLIELPGYLQHARAALIPFKCNALTAGIYPLKLNEYLSAGKPVVATSFSEDIRAFHAAVFLAEKPETFAHLLQQALDSDSEQQRAERLKVAAQNSWTARAEAFRRLFDLKDTAAVKQKTKMTYEKAVK